MQNYIESCEYMYKHSDADFRALYRDLVEMYNCELITEPDFHKAVTGLANNAKKYGFDSVWDIKRDKGAFWERIWNTWVAYKVKDIK
jgi:hypothetical protein